MRFTCCNQSRKVNVDPCIYYDITDKSIVIIAIYVNDILIIWNDIQKKDQIKQELKTRFKMKDLCEASQMLGMRVEQKQEEGQILVNQEQYIKKILKKFNMSDCNPCSTPMDPNVKLSKNESVKTDEKNGSNSLSRSHW